MIFRPSNAEEQFLEIGRYIHACGIERNKGRTAEAFSSIFGAGMCWDLNDGENFPLFHSKTVFLRGIIHELLWFIKGDTNTNYLVENNVHIWDEWADADGNLGAMYGKQLRAFGDQLIDQLGDTIRDIKNRPQSRRHVITLWNPEDLPDESMTPHENVAAGRMALACCHGTFIQFFIDDEAGEIHMMTHQRSADWYVGVPFNLASYSLLLMLVARSTGLKARTVKYTFGDVHYYHNQMDAINEWHDNVHKWEMKYGSKQFPTPKMIIPAKDSIDDYTIDDFELVGYDPMGVIKFPRPAV